MHSDYIVFVDESGDHSLEKIDQAYPMFVLAFCLIPFAVYNEQVAPAIRRLKFNLFGHDTVVLHETDIVRRRKAFAGLSEPQRTALMTGLGEVIQQAQITIIAIAVDKARHAARYRQPEHPYHLAMQFGLERLHSQMTLLRQQDRLTHVVFECRGQKEDDELELAFRRVCDGRNAAQERLNFAIIMADKKCNSEGLQICDLVARPIGRHVLNPAQQNRAFDLIRPKLATNARGRAEGWGLKVFP